MKRQLLLSGLFRNETLECLHTRSSRWRSRNRCAETACERARVSFAHTLHHIIITFDILLYLDVLGPFCPSLEVSNAGKQVGRKYNKPSKISEILLETVEAILHLKENIEKNQRDRAQKDKQKADQDWGQDLQRLSERFCWVLKDFLLPC